MDLMWQVQDRNTVVVYYITNLKTFLKYPSILFHICSYQIKSHPKDIPSIDAKGARHIAKAVGTVLITQAFDNAGNCFCASNHHYLRISNWTQHLLTVTKPKYTPTLLQCGAIDYIYESRAANRTASLNSKSHINSLSIVLTFHQIHLLWLLNGMLRLLNVHRAILKITHTIQR